MLISITGFGEVITLTQKDVAHIYTAAPVLFNRRHSGSSKKTALLITGNKYR